MEQAALTGKLVITGDGWGLVRVPHAILKGFFDALHEPGIVPSPNLAHITVFPPADTVKIGADKITERGRDFNFFIKGVKSFRPKGWKDMEKCWVLDCRSPELEALRKSYGLTPLPYGEHEFHVTFAVRREGVLQENRKSKYQSPTQRLASKVHFNNLYKELLKRRGEFGKHADGADRAFQLQPQFMQPGALDAQIARDEKLKVAPQPPVLPPAAVYQAPIPATRQTNLMPVRVPTVKQAENFVDPEIRKAHNLIKKFGEPPHVAAKKAVTSWAMKQHGPAVASAPATDQDQTKVAADAAPVALPAKPVTALWDQLGTVGQQRVRAAMALDQSAPARMSVLSRVKAAPVPEPGPDRWKHLLAETTQAREQGLKDNHVGSFGRFFSNTFGPLNDRVDSYAKMYLADQEPAQDSIGMDGRTTLQNNLVQFGGGGDASAKGTAALARAARFPRLAGASGVVGKVLGKATPVLFANDLGTAVRGASHDLEHDELGLLAGNRVREQQMANWRWPHRVAAGLLNWSAASRAAVAAPTEFANNTPEHTREWQHLKTDAQAAMQLVREGRMTKEELFRRLPVNPELAAQLFDARDQETGKTPGSWVNNLAGVQP